MTKRALIKLIAAAPVLLCIDCTTEGVAAGQSNEPVFSGKTTNYPTMLAMTFPEFEATAKRTDIVLLPIGAIEEHSPHLPLGTDAMNATAQVFHVQNYLRKAGFETILGPPLNIGITNEASDRARDGTYAYPGSLAIGKETFVALYVDVLRSLHLGFDRANFGTFAVGGFVTRPEMPESALAAVKEGGTGRTSRETTQASGPGHPEIDGGNGEQARVDTVEHTAVSGQK